VTRTAVERGPETDAVLTLLEGAALLVGDGIRPAGGGFPGDDPTQDFVPYAVLYQGVTTDIDGPVSDPNADTASEYQVTSIGVTRPQASFVADKARHAMLEQTLTVTGRCVQLVEWTQGRNAERDDDVTPPLFYAIDIYTISTSPA
jgi:hypothetical protein